VFKFSPSFPPVDEVGGFFPVCGEGICSSVALSNSVFLIDTDYKLRVCADWENSLWEDVMCTVQNLVFG